MMIDRCFRICSVIVLSNADANSRPVRCKSVGYPDRRNNAGWLCLSDTAPSCRKLFSFHTNLDSSLAGLLEIRSTLHTVSHLLYTYDDLRPPGFSRADILGGTESSHSIESHERIRSSSQTLAEPSNGPFLRKKWVNYQREGSLVTKGYIYASVRDRNSSSSLGVSNYLLRRILCQIKHRHQQHNHNRHQILRHQQHPLRILEKYLNKRYRLHCRYHLSPVNRMIQHGAYPFRRGQAVNENFSRL